MTGHSLVILSERKSSRRRNRAWYAGRFRVSRQPYRFRFLRSDRPNGIVPTLSWFSSGSDRPTCKEFCSRSRKTSGLTVSPEPEFLRIRLQTQKTPKATGEPTSVTLHPRPILCPPVRLRRRHAYAAVGSAVGTTLLDRPRSISANFGNRVQRRGQPGTHDRRPDQRTR